MCGSGGGIVICCGLDEDILPDTSGGLTAAVAPAKMRVMDELRRGGAIFDTPATSDRGWVGPAFTLGRGLVIVYRQGIEFGG